MIKVEQKPITIEARANEETKQIEIGHFGINSGEMVNMDRLSVQGARELARQLNESIKLVSPRTSAGHSLANAGKPWTAKEDEKLLAAWKAGHSIAIIAEDHKRTKAGIEARLERHNQLKRTL